MERIAPPFYHVFADDHNIQAFVGGLAKTCGPQPVKESPPASGSAAMGSASQGINSSAGDGDGGEALPDGASDAATPTPRKRLARITMSMASVRDQMKKLSTT